MIMNMSTLTFRVECKDLWHFISGLLLSVAHNRSCHGLQSRQLRFRFFGEWWIVCQIEDSQIRQLIECGDGDELIVTQIEELEIR